MLLLVDDVKEPVHRGAVHEIGSLFQREVNVKETGHHREAHTQDGNPLLNVTTLKILLGESLLLRDNPQRFG